jgi:hypothetical protein
MPEVEGPGRQYRLRTTVVTFGRADMTSEDTGRRIGPRLRDRPLVESRKQSAPGRTIEQSRDLKAISGLVSPDRCLGLGRKDAFDRPRVKPKLAQILLRDLDVAGGQNTICRRLYARKLLGLRSNTSGQQHHHEPPENRSAVSSHTMLSPSNVQSVGSATSCQR